MPSFLLSEHHLSCLLFNSNKYIDKSDHTLASGSGQMKYALDVCATCWQSDTKKLILPNALKNVHIQQLNNWTKIEPKVLFRSFLSFFAKYIKCQKVMGKVKKSPSFPVDSAIEVSILRRCISGRTFINRILAAHS